MQGDPRIPLSIIGYADWLYCRRNGIVHGGGNRKLSDQDFDHLRSAYPGVKKLARRFLIKISSVKTVQKFYSDVSRLLENSNELK